MIDPARRARLERNLRLYRAYHLAFGFWFWIPVFFLFFSQHLSLEEVLRLEAIYYAGVVLLEVPSGYASDAFGRRRTLIVSAAALVASYAIFFSAQGFWQFAVAQLLLAAGYAFNSGTDTALHYDSLSALGRADEYADREARVSRISFSAAAAGALLGGAVGALELRFAYGLSLISALSTLGIVLAFAEPRSLRDRPALGPVSQFRAVASLLRQPALAWLFGFAVAMTVLIHIPYEFYQPYLDRLAEQGGSSALGRRLSELPVPLASGLVTALSMLVGAWFAGRSARLAERMGTTPALLTGLGVIVGITAIMGRVLAGWVVILILFRNGARGLMTAPLNAAVTPRLPEAQRATYLSAQSLAGRLGFSATLLTLSAAAGGAHSADWLALSQLLSLGAGLGLLLWLAMALSARAAGVDSGDAAGLA